MVIRITIIFTVLLLLISCKMKNLYQRDIRMKKNKVENLNKIRFDGYYYRFEEDRYNQGKMKITSVFFMKEGLRVNSFYTSFENFKEFEKFLLSDDFNLMLRNNKYLIKPFLIEGDKIISQSVIGGGNFAKHVSTTVTQIESLEKIKDVKGYGLDIYIENEEYIFKKFKKIYKVKEKINM
ncbi:Probable lipoprotein precursor [Tenacibaculum maritimum]|nr:Probable lipoprotein precursor [Tenacibaculum maritimum]CAA0233827.1 Probable lipoprotein precursor [Tenacibaculum maritimum]